ncbi:M42 family metallopeptidase [Mycoplasma miroungirhinis]|uniref:M42 family metallopeptidase n=1 Tax=Mycoplasma miroungirhinis TaxID=754516 RepID=A0A6M4JDE1_9MOLU|nr:M42 family metallopeptidase [Mycoplasma miroungirhinis]QJR44097.1 M42 family metallopeptidase [Mycoplasma miroungirhinis]
MNKKQFKEKLIKYMELEAMSRYEEPVANELKNSTKSPNFQYSYDNFGSLIIFKKSKINNAPKVMISAHMDEVGYIVRMIDKTGQLLLMPIGGIWASVAVATKATLVTNKDNKRFIGVFGHTSIHVMTPNQVNNALKNNELFADFGFKNYQDAVDNGVEVGDRVYMSGETIIFNDEDLIGGKAMDNRAGVMTLEYIANEIKDLELACDVYLVGTVQEEVGTRGAKTSVTLIEPDIAIALDTTTSHDTYSIVEGNTKLQAGAALRVFDRDTLMDPKLINFIVNIGLKNNINFYKYVAVGGGTDAGELQYGKGGVSTLTISIPQRYLHSPIGVSSIHDMMSSGNLIIEFLKKLTPNTYLENIKHK